MIADTIFSVVNNEDFSKEFVPDLRRYMAAHSAITLLEMFREGGGGCSPLAPEVSARNTIAALLAEEVERQKGVAGVKELINCGAGDDNYFVELNELIAVNPANFEEKVHALVDRFR